MQDRIPSIDSPDGLFHDGNPATGEMGTIVPSAHLNNVQSGIQDLQTCLLYTSPSPRDCS